MINNQIPFGTDFYFATKFNKMEKITKDNFITDDKTNKVYISSLIDKVSGDLDRQTRCGIKDAIKEFAGNCEFLYNTMDVWARDYMPVQLTIDSYMSYIYKPDYLDEYPECITHWQIHKVHTHKQYEKDKLFDFKYIQIPLILDGGNIIKAIVNGNPCIIMNSKVLDENNVNEEDFYTWWKKWWADNFDGTEMELVLLPWEGPRCNPIGHADGIVRYISEGKVLMTNYGDFDNRFNDYHGGLMKEKLEEVGFEVIMISFEDKFDYDHDKIYNLLFEHSWSYINFLQVGHRIILPKLGYEKLDNEALIQIEKAFNHNGNDYEVSQIQVDMTPIIAGNGANNSGGALNCLTWTVFN